MATDPTFAPLLECLSDDPTLAPRADGTLDSARVAARFVHPAKWPTLGRAALPPATLTSLAAQVLGYATSAYDAVLAELATVAREAARALLEVPQVRAATDRLPWRAGDRVLALGDSITDDSLSWANLLPHLLALAGHDGIEVINAGISGDTTGHVIDRFDLLEATEPTWVVAMIGTNDARRHGRVAQARIVSPAETRRNLDVIAGFVTAQLGAKLVTMTPPTLVVDLTDHFDAFQAMQIRWRSHDLADVAQAVRATTTVVADIHRDFGDPPPQQLLQPDGLHPSLAGQQFILARLLDGLALLDPHQGSGAAR